MEHIDTLAAAFGALTDEQLANLLWHAERGTPICCGDRWQSFVDSGGAG